MFPGKVNRMHPSIFSPSNALGTSVTPRFIQDNPSDCIDITQPELQSENLSQPEISPTCITCITPKSKLSLPNTVAKNIYPGQFRQALSNAELEDAVAFLKKNTDQSDRLIREYYIPLPKGITHAQALLDCLPNLNHLSDLIAAAESVRFICRANYLETCFSETHYTEDNVTSSCSALRYLAAALHKDICVEMDEGKNTYALYERSGIGSRIHILESNLKVIGSDFQTCIVNKDEKKLNNCIYIQRIQWKNSANKLKFLADKCLIDKKDLNTYALSYGELLKKALQQSCKEKFDKAEAKGRDQIIKKFHSSALMKYCYLKIGTGSLKNPIDNK